MLVAEEGVAEEELLMLGEEVGRPSEEDERVVLVEVEEDLVLVDKGGVYAGGKVDEGGVFAGAGPEDEDEELVLLVDAGGVYGGGAPIEEDELTTLVDEEVLVLVDGGGVYAGKAIIEEVEELVIPVDEGGV